jgi:hypothetical protein
VAGPSYTHAELEALWDAAGGSSASADIAAAIAQAESGGCQYAKAGPTDDRPVNACTYRQTTLESSYGLWQINRYAHPQYTAASLYTAAGNATAAVEVSQAGLSFLPWTTFTSGAYVQYLDNPANAVQGQTVEPLSSAGTGKGVSAHQVDQAWSKFMRTLAITVPHELDKVSAARARIRNAVR